MYFFDQTIVLLFLWCVLYPLMLGLWRFINLVEIVFGRCYFVNFYLVILYV